MQGVELTHLLKKVFIGREDVVAVNWESTDGKKGYKPLRDKFGEYIPLSNSLLQKHVDGQFILALYPLLKDCSCSFIAADFDDHAGTGNPIEDVKRYYSSCIKNGVPIYVFRSKSGSGYHVYIFFDDLVPASQARALATKFLSLSGILESKNSFDRLFPAQDVLSGKGFGSPIALPFQGKAMINGNTLLLDNENDFTVPFNDQVSELNRIKKVSFGCFSHFVKEETQVETKRAAKKKQVYSQPETTTEYSARDEILADFDKVYQECYFIAHCKNDATSLPYMHWWALITNVVRCTNGPKLVHQLSRPYPRYSSSETERMISEAVKFPYPHTCAYIGERISGEYCSTCRYVNKIRYPVMIGIDLFRFADTLSYENEVEFYPESAEISEASFNNDHVEEDYQLAEDWSGNIDDMDSDFWENHMDGPGDDELSRMDEGDEFEEFTLTYINRYVCSNCLSPNRLSSDIANKVLINAYCQVCGEYGKLIHYKAFKYPVI